MTPVGTNAYETFGNLGVNYSFGTLNNSAPCDRKWLHQNWAQYKNIMRPQPLDRIRDYFGEKVALYFTFIGFYTKWLILFSLVGGFVLVHGLNTYQTDTFVNETCTAEITMCPLCDEESLNIKYDLIQLNKLYNSELPIGCRLVQTSNWFSRTYV